MSTTKIREALDHMEACDTGAEAPLVSAARAELEAIRKAAKTLDRLHVGDFTYNIRDRAAGDAAFTGDMWEHPDVKAWSDASVTMSSIAKEE